MLGIKRTQAGDDVSARKKKPKVVTLKSDVKESEEVEEEWSGIATS